MRRKKKDRLSVYKKMLLEIQAKNLEKIENTLRNIRRCEICGEIIGNRAYIKEKRAGETRYRWYHLDCFKRFIKEKTAPKG